MTHAESQDLLLDLAYGELPPDRAEEVLGHVAGCAECQREKAALDEARRLTAPLRELEEPSAGFDDCILAAAKAQAQLDNDGQIGQVIEVSGSVKPLGLEPARIDAHGPVAARSERRRPRWALRVALGGLVAAAAALALVVSTSLQTKQAKERAAQFASDKTAFEIDVPPASAPAAVAEKEALQQAQEQRAEAPKSEAAPAAERKQKAAEPAPPQQRPEKMAQKKDRPAEKGMLGALGGSGGDAASSLSGSGVAAGSESGKRPAATLDVEFAQPAAAPPAAAAVRNERAVVKKEQALAKSDTAVALASNAPSAAALEAEAQRSRHAGNYGLAASIYQRAAKLPRAPGDQAESPAWDLAHAVECLAAAGLFDEARQVRDQLSELYPSEKTAYSAAGRALREVETAPPARGPSSKPPAKAKAQPSDSDESIPSKF